LIPAGSDPHNAGMLLRLLLRLVDRVLGIGRKNDGPLDRA